MITISVPCRLTALASNPIAAQPIELEQGESAVLTFAVADDAGAPVDISAGALLLTVRRAIGGATVISRQADFIDAAHGTASVLLDPSETATVRPGALWYEVTYLVASEVHHVRPPDALTLLASVYVPGDTVTVPEASQPLAKGPKGDQGDPGINWRGAYDGATAYAVRDAVSYGGASYYCTVAATGIVPTDTGHWALIADKGQDGQDGDPGPVGLLWRGAYDGATAYVARDGVSYQGRSYYCTVAATGVLPTDTGHWALIADKGDDGVGQWQSPPGTDIPARTAIAVDGTLLLAADDAANNRTVLSAPGLVPITRRIVAGPGLAGGGDMAGDPTLSMPAVGPGAGTIGGAGQAVSQLTLDAQGRVTAVTAGAIGGTLSGLTAGKIPRATGASAVGNGSISDDGAGNIAVVGKITAGAVWSAYRGTQVSSVAAAATLAPTTGIVQITSSGTIYTITPPAAGWTGVIKLIIAGAYTVYFGSGGNISAGSQGTASPDQVYDCVYDGATWTIYGKIINTGNVSWSSPWIGFSNPVTAYKDRDGKVQLIGKASKGAIALANDELVGTLPAGFIPPNNVYYPVIVSAGAAIATLQVATGTGQMRMRFPPAGSDGTWVDFSAVGFYAG